LHQDYEHRHIQIQQRIKDMEDMIDQVEGPIIVSGHSFGGATCLAVAARNTSGRIVACLAKDPWIFSLHKEIEEKKWQISVPTIVLNTCSFHATNKPEWDGQKYIDMLLDNMTEGTPLLALKLLK
jgi:hypothetical protein